ncbi:MAG: DUF5666 domain-containing protein [Vicinamibacterales bacterium]|jgi:hypothetical protein|nr:DUF5666 domain-containing protein [Vicinamibacterales bacterium]
MRQVLTVVAVALVVSLVWAPVTSAQTKWVRGTVVSVTGDTFVVKAAGQEMTFKVDTSTELTARGAGKAQAAAEAKGAAGVKFADFVKSGVGVEVHYKDVGGTMMATEVHSGLPPTEGSVSKESTSGGSARGTITAISNASVSVKGDAQDWTFSVDPKTLVLGTGMGTITRQFKEQGKSPTITDLLGVNDRIVVYFKEAGGAVRASEIRVIAKAAK